MTIVKQEVKRVDLKECGSKIEYAGRVCYKSQDKITENSKDKFIASIVKRGHTSVLEHEEVVFLIKSSLYYDSGMADIFENPLKDTRRYFNYTFFEGIVVMSGNVRVWLNSMKETKDLDNYCIEYIYSLLRSKYPTVFEGIRTVKDITDISDEDICLLEDYEQLGERVEDHEIITYEITTDRGTTHQLVRHRSLSFSQESQRYCVAGDTVLKTKNPHLSLTVEEMYNNKVDNLNGAWRRILIKQLDEQSGTLMYSKINDIFKMGEKECFEVTTKLGYKLECTKDHEIYTPNGYKRLENIKQGDFIYVNGKTLDDNKLYKDYDWLYNQYKTLSKTPRVIGEEFNFSQSVIKKWIRKLGIEYNKRECGTIGKVLWNKGLKKADDERVKRQGDALRKYHHNGRSKDDNEILKTTFGKVIKSNLEVIGGDEVVSIKSVGVKEVYDISMPTENHNFVANGIIVHNCNYSVDKFDNSVRFIIPNVDDTDKDCRFVDAYKKAEKMYFELIEKGVKPETARQVLPNGCASTIIISGTKANWRKFLDLRCDSHAQREIRELAERIKEDLGVK